MKALNDVVELGVGTTSKEFVELHHKAEVHILALGVLTNNLPLMPVANINTLI